MQIKDKGALTFLGKLKGDPSKRSRDKYCHFHRDHSYDTSDCYDLKQQIKALIRQGKLQRFIGKERMDQPQETPTQRENEHPRPPLRDIRNHGRNHDIWLIQEGTENLPTDGLQCPVNEICPEDGTVRQPYHWFYRGRCQAPPPPSRCCACD